MMNFKKHTSVLLTTAALGLLTLCIVGCLRDSREGVDVSSDPEKLMDKPQLLIYCGVTMITPMTEIAATIEQQENCVIRITKGGSGNLLKSILHNQTGDLYLPGSEGYFAKIEEADPGLITKSVFVGHNKAALMVRKGNPLGISSSDLSCLTDPRYGIILGNPESGSIGKETKVILDRAGIFDAVVENAMLMATDSKDILRSIKKGQADIGINWIATSTWEDNAELVEVIEIDPAFAETKKLVIGELKYTKHPEICEAFMALASSAEGREIFRKNGLYFD